MILDAVVSLPIRSFKAVGANSKTSVLFAHKKTKPDEKQGSVFMAKASEIGFERDTKFAKKIGLNDLDTILDEYRNHKKTDEKISVLSQNPPCFLVSPELILDRIDASYFYAEYVFDLKVDECRVKDVATPYYVNANLKDNPHDKIHYIEYGSIDKHLGDITNTTEYYGNSAPNRAKFRVKEGVVISAKMLDSEKNVAIIPPYLDNQVASNGFVILEPKHPMTSEALFVVLRKDTTTEQIRWRAIGTIMPTVSNDDYLNLKIPKLSEIQIKEYTDKIRQYNKEANERKKYLRNLFLK